MTQREALNVLGQPVAPFQVWPLLMLGVAAGWVLVLLVYGWRQARSAERPTSEPPGLTPLRYLGVHLLLGLLLSVGALALFGALANEVVGPSRVTDWDLRVANGLHAQATPTSIAVWRAITTLGNGSTLIGLAVGLGLVLMAQRRWLLLGGVLLAMAGGGYLNLGLKLLFQRPRPSFADAFVTEQSWSFPSGHAMGSLIGYGLLAYLLVLNCSRRWLRTIIILSAGVLIALIGMSRMYLGAHYVSDVVAGFASGMVWLSACISGLEAARRRRLRPHVDAAHRSTA